jgi:gluconolactonase
VPHGRIFVARTDGTVELVLEYGGEPNGLKFDSAGSLVICDHHLGLLRFDLVAGQLSSLCRGPEKEHFKGVNDLVFGRDGALYFTDQGGTGMHDPSGRVYRLGPDGDLRALVTNVPSPNGLVFNESETILYVAATRSSSIWMLPLTKAGGVTKAGIFARMPGGGPDGMAADVAGNIAVAHPSLGCVWLFNRKGIPTHRVLGPSGAHVTNIAYGGPDNDWLYYTDGTSFGIWRARMPHPGRALTY